jgi:probable F420-dependent oxidoreductase
VLRYVYQYPETTGTEGDMLDAGGVAEVAAAAEAAGWHGLSFTEHPAPSARWLDSGGHQALDPFVALSHAAAVTRRLRLLTYLTVVPYRNPLLLAKSAATVDKLSGGRMVLGVGTGYLKSEYFALGVDFEERNRLFDEALDVLPLHWKGEPFSYKGRHFEARDVIGLPRPVQQPIPIWIGGNSNITRRRVAERAQGWMPLMASRTVATTARTPNISGVSELASMVADLREAAGDRSEQIDVAVTYSDPSIADPTTDPERHKEALGVLGSAGATWIVVSGTSHDPRSTFEFIEGFGQTYL